MIFTERFHNRTCHLRQLRSKSLTLMFLKGGCWIYHVGLLLLVFCFDSWPFYRIVAAKSKVNSTCFQRGFDWLIDIIGPGPNMCILSEGDYFRSTLFPCWWRINLSVALWPRLVSVVQGCISCGSISLCWFHCFPFDKDWWCKSSHSFQFGHNLDWTWATLLVGKVWACS